MTEHRPPAPGGGDTPTATSLTLLDRVRAADPDAWRRLVHLYSPLIFSWARRAGLGDSDAADVVQDVWQSVAASLDRFQRDTTSGTFRGWIWTIARNKVRDLFRKRQGEPAGAGGTDACRLLQSVPEEEPADEGGTETHLLLHRALEQIRPEFEERTWQAFWRMTVDGRPAAEVGEELGMAANAVHQAKFRILRRLRQEMVGLVEA
jgi:RNA polymerase sigma-70 factor (ECF subfamily)